MMVLEFQRMFCRRYFAHFLLQKVKKALASVCGLFMILSPNTAGTLKPQAKSHCNQALSLIDLKSAF